VRLDTPVLVRHWFKRPSQLALATGVVVTAWPRDGAEAGELDRIPKATAPSTETASRRLTEDLRALASAPKTRLEIATTQAQRLEPQRSCTPRSV